MPPKPLRPKRAGTIFRYAPAKPGEAQGHYIVRCSAPDGTRPIFHLDPSAESPKAEAKALRSAEAITEKLWKTGEGAAPLRERAKRKVTDADVKAANAWWDTFFKHRDALGMGSVSGVYKTHIRPVLDLPWSAITPADVERLRDAFDTKVANGEASAKTMFNAWAVWTVASKAAAGQWKKDKRRALKERDDDPSAGIAGPDYDTDDTKQLQWLYPREVLAIAACKDVPLAARRRIVLSTYLCVRGGELKALTWDKIDLERGVIRVDEAYDRERDATKATKTGNRGARRYTIEPALLPLLKAMHRETGGVGPVVPMGLQKLWAVELRNALAAAEVKRPELFATTDASKRVRFHDLRASGLTWMAIRGDSPVHIKLVAGHTAFEMTSKYIAAAGAVDLLPGETVFPELPENLIKPPEPSGVRKVGRLSQNLSQELQLLETIVEAPGIEPPQKCRNEHVLGSIRDRQAPGKVTQSDDKCAIAQEPVTDRDRTEEALAKAIELAAGAGEWGVVSELGRQLAERARVRQAPGVASLDAYGGPHSRQSATAVRAPHEPIKRLTGRLPE